MIGDAECVSASGSRPSQYRALVDRCLLVEAGHAELRGQLSELVESSGGEEEAAQAAGAASGSENPRPSLSGLVPGFFRGGSPYKRILESIGHAVHVCRASSEEIVYWNRSAEDLYGWKDYEVIGRQINELLVAQEFYPSFQNIMEKLRSGQSWSGQFPFRKRSGEGFMATVTKSPLYEGGELSCVITVSSDAAHFNGRSLEKLRAQGKNANGIPRPQGLKRIQWQSRPQIAPIPQIASSVSSLASKVLPRRNGDNAQNVGFSGMNDTTETDGAMLEKPGKLAAKLLEKLHIKGNGNQVKENETYQQIRHKAMCIGPAHELASGSCQGSLRPVESDESLCMKTPGLAERESTDSETSAIPPRFGETSMLSSPRGCNECFHLPGSRDLLPQAHCLAHKETADRGDLNDLLLKDEVQNHDSKQTHSSGESVHSHGSSSSKGDSDVSATVCEIRWEDLKLGEEIGQGSCAVVYRGIWMGSDVAVKVYVGNDYCEDTLQVYKKEIHIMERLRHPNVLLFMGAICSQERLAIVTEFLPRGSLFKALHKNNQALDMRRRLRMALDVARGMNYLHHRNPPIVHRDLKSSNLLVDRNWTVKVADFGLSRLKDATLITTKSGRGTPQWMAPEVLRNEPSNEKSDVFSFGVVLWELMTESIPWNNLNFLQVVGVVGFMDRRLDLPVGIDPRIASLIQDCWQSEPDRRPSFEEILQRLLSFVPGAAAPSVQKDPHS